MLSFAGINKCEEIIWGILKRKRDIIATIKVNTGSLETIHMAAAVCR